MKDINIMYIQRFEKYLSGSIILISFIFKLLKNRILQFNSAISLHC